MKSKLLIVTVMLLMLTTKSFSQFSAYLPLVDNVEKDSPNHMKNIFSISYEYDSIILSIGKSAYLKESLNVYTIGYIKRFSKVFTSVSIGVMDKPNNIIYRESRLYFNSNLLLDDLLPYVSIDVRYPLYKNIGIQGSFNILNANAGIYVSL